ncbi:hypothetical protein [Bacillus sp. 1P06AnD]|uniref:hypothetical protein n=1 Tax=Bacillus sp. 1P06AnD TaxID=3132208 RepID=UPI0039A100C0
MCLPSIIDIAQKQGLEINPRSLHKKEVYAKCPFCLSDANKKGKYKLSLNQDANVFKCWVCGEHGGVLDFESKLTGVSYLEVKQKYFGQRKDTHPVDMLSPNQLKEIGWAEYKRKNRVDFFKKREAVIKEWKDHERFEKMKHYAMLQVISCLENQEDRKEELLVYLSKSCEQSQVNMLFSFIMAEFIKEPEEKAEWVEEAIHIARAAWKTCLLTHDFDFDQVLLNIIFLLYTKEMTMKHMKINGHLNRRTS